MSFVDQFLQSGALFSLSPSTVAIGWGRREWITSPISSENPCYYFPDFFLKAQNPWCTHRFNQEIEIEALIGHLENSQSSQISFSPLEWKRFDKQHFKNKYDSLESQLLAGTLQKGVPYVFETAEAKMTPERLVSSLLSLLRKLQTQPLYAYGFWKMGEGFLGATPEVLFRAFSPNHRRIETMACAGTSRNFEGTDRSLQHSKNQHEHHLVIQGIKDSVKTSGGILKVHPTQSVQFSLLTHLVTPLDAEFSQDLQFEEIVREFHPTPALGAHPKKSGKQWLEEQEKILPRHRFGAPAGILLPEKGSLCVVAIRNVQWCNNQFMIGAGCGVVAGSRFEDEWNEILLKISSTKKILNL